MINTITEQELNSRIKSGAIYSGKSNGWLLWGDEDYTKLDALRRMTAAAENRTNYGDANDGDGNTFGALTETVRFFGDSYDSAALADAVMTAPVFCTYRTVIIRDLPIDKLNNKQYAADLATLYRILGALGENPSVMLVLCLSSDAFDTDDNGKRIQYAAFRDKLSEYLTAVEFTHPDESRLRRWIARHFNTDGLQITVDAVSELLYLTSRSMFTLSSEIEKLTAFALEKNKVSVELDDVRLVCCRGLDEEAFTLSNALSAMDAARAFEAVRRMKLRRESPVVICAMTARPFINMFRVAELISRGMSVQAAAAKLKMNGYVASNAARDSRRFTREQLCEIVSAAAEADAKLKSANIGYVPVDRLLSVIFRTSN